MYNNHFGLHQAPFTITPDLGFFFRGNKRNDILEALIYAVENGVGIIKVTGEVGCGKTMLCRMLESRISEHVEIIYLVNPTMTREQVIYTIASELGLPIVDKRVDEVIRLLNSTLISKHASGRQVVVLVEEAQAMSLETLEEIRLISNLETAHHKLLQIVLFGQPELDEHLNLPSMRQLKERITASFTVPPLAFDATLEYVMFRMRTAGYRGPDIFSDAAVKRIAKASKGILRRISILADKSLLAAFADDSHIIKPKHVDAAIRDTEFYKPTFWLSSRLNIASAVAALLLFTLGVGWHFISPSSLAAPSLKTTTIASNPPSPKLEIKSTTTLDEKIKRTKTWLNQQPVDRYSIQLAVFSSQNQRNIDHFLQKIESETGLDNVHVVPVKTNNIRRVSVLYGSYATRSEALKALYQLSEEWGYQPQLHTIGKIKSEMTV